MRAASVPREISIKSCAAFGHRQGCQIDDAALIWIFEIECGVGFEKEVGPLLENELVLLEILCVFLYYFY